MIRCRIVHFLSGCVEVHSEGRQLLHTSSAARHTARYGLFCCFARLQENQEDTKKEAVTSVHRPLASKVFSDQKSLSVLTNNIRSSLFGEEWWMQYGYCYSLSARRNACRTDTRNRPTTNTHHTRLARLMKNKCAIYVGVVSRRALGGQRGRHRSGAEGNPRRNRG